MNSPHIRESTKDILVYVGFHRIYKVGTVVHATHYARLGKYSTIGRLTDTMIAWSSSLRKMVRECAATVSWELWQPEDLPRSHRL